MPGGSVRAFDANGNPIDVPEEEVDGAFRSGAIQFRPGTHVEVYDPSGRLGHVPVEDLSRAVEGGYRFAPTGETQRRGRRAELGEQTGQAAVEGLARGVTVGVSDAALGSDDPITRRVAAGVLGSPQEDLPEQQGASVVGRQEENPWAAGAGETVGVLGSAVIPGSMAARAGAGVVGRAAASGLGGAGVLADAATAATTAGARRVAVGVGSQALAGSIEGAVAEVGLSYGRAELEDQEFTGEALAGALERGALFGAGGGAVGGLVAPAVGRAFRGLREAMSSSNLDARAGRLAAEHLRPRASDVRALGREGLRLEEVGNMVLDEGAIGPRVGRRQMAEALDAAVQDVHAPRLAEIAAELDAVGHSSPARAVQEALEEALGDSRTPVLAAIRRQLSEAIDVPTPTSALTPDDREALRFLDALDGEAAARRADGPATTRATMGAGDAGASDAAARRARNREIREAFAEDKALKEAEKKAAREAERVELAGAPTVSDVDGAGRLRAPPLPPADAPQPQWGLGFESPAQRSGATMGAMLEDAAQASRDMQRRRILGDATEEVGEASIGFAALHSLRRAIDDELADAGARLSPIQKRLGEARRVVDQALDAMRRESSVVDDVARRWDDANRRYHGLRVAASMARNSLAQEAVEAGSRGLSRRDFGIGMGMAAIYGRPGLMVAGWMSGAMREWMRKNGKALGAVSGRRMARVSAFLERAFQADRLIGRAARAALFPARAATSTKVRAIQMLTFESKVEEALRASTDPASYDVDDPNRVTPRDVADISMVAAQSIIKSRVAVARALKEKALASMPPSSAFRARQDAVHGVQVSDGQKMRFLRFEQVARDPLSIVDTIESDSLTRDHVEALRMVYPAMYNRLVETIQDEMMSSNEPISYQKRLQLMLLLPGAGGELDPSLRPAAIRKAQERFIETRGGAMGGQMSVPPGTQPQPENPTPQLPESGTKTSKIAEM